MRSISLLLLAASIWVAGLSFAHAGGAAIGWADAVGVFSDEATAMGALAVILGIAAVGCILMFGITSMITTVVMVCLGGALLANADAVAGAIFGIGGGGGSVLLYVS